MFEDSLGRGERQARAMVTLVLVVEAIWILFHKYLPLDAALWTLQGDLIGEHMSGHSAPGLSVTVIPGAGILIPYLSAFVQLLLGGEIASRILFVLVGVLWRGLAMLAILRLMRVRDEGVYYLVPVFVLSGIFFVGSLPYLAGEAFAYTLLYFFLRQEHPRRIAYWILAIGFALTALAHPLAYLVCIVFTFTIANEQRRSVHLSQGWLSNLNAVIGLLIPGLVILLLRLFIPGNPFMLTSSGLTPVSGTEGLLFLATATPYVVEAAFPSADILFTVTSGLTILLVIAALFRAFLLPMEEVSWQSRTTKATGAILLVCALLGPLAEKIGVQPHAFLWFALFVLLAGSYSRGPAVRRNIIDRVLNVMAFATMVAAGVLNGLAVNRGSDAASDVLRGAAELIRAEKHTLEMDKGLMNVDVHYLIDDRVIDVSRGYVGSYSYTVTAPLYLYADGFLLDRPSYYQPNGGAMYRLDDGRFTSPRDTLSLDRFDRILDPKLRILAALPFGETSTPLLGKYGRALSDTAAFTVDHGDQQYQLMIGTLTPSKFPGLAFREIEH
jgi:hypothetical protein